MKKTFLTAAVLAGLACLSAVSAKAASYTNTSGSVIAGDIYTNLNIGKFDQRLGTLTGITVTIDFSTLQGSFDVTNNALDTATVNHVRNDLYIRQKVGSGLGFSSVSKSFVDEVLTTPDWSSTTIAANGGKVTFTVAAGQNFVTNQSASVDLVNWGAYESADGSGNVVFQASVGNPITATGGQFTVDSSQTKVATKMSVTYAYTAIPEPTTWALIAGGIGMLVIGQRIRRRSS